MYMQEREKLLGESKIWGRGYTTIPLTVRRVLGLKNGDKLEWFLGKDGQIYVVKGGSHQ